MAEQKGNTVVLSTQRTPLAQNRALARESQVVAELEVGGGKLAACYFESTGRSL